MNIDMPGAETYNAAQHAETAPRKTAQQLMPITLDENLASGNSYNIYPFHALGSQKIFSGFDTLAHWIADQKTVVLDGYVGIFWHKIQAELDSYFTRAGLSVNWIQTANFFKTPYEVDNLVCPFLGADDSVWGTKCTLSLADLFDIDRLATVVPGAQYKINIIIGTGAAIANWEAPIVYIDLPKNELQFRMRGGSIYNLGCTETGEASYMYKRFYFVDWVLLNAHKKQLLNRISVIADGQWPEAITWMFGATLVDALNTLSQSVFRVRPWFEPGAWGGQWLKNQIPSLNTNVINYAWSFELIVPENGLVFESDGQLLEVSFDMLMFADNAAVLGRHAATFGDEFPIRFDFLDTFNGGNLSIQCHPSRPYIQTHFGENITQDETYYILDCQAGAQVYLGFQDGIEPTKFKQALIASQDEGVALNITDFVQAHPASTHDLFLIPNQTIHSAGAGNLVLEISATPYIFTFKMYDWLRLDLDGKPRPINIEHAFHNLDFSRKGSRVQQELLSKPFLLLHENDVQLFHLPTHAEHFYDVHRIEFDTSVFIDTNDTCHVLMLVEGQSITVATANGTTQKFAFAETFVIPAAAASYRLTNTGQTRAKVIKAFLK